MSRLTRINRSIVESPIFEEADSDIVYRLPLPTGEDVLFTAERQFFTPRKIATNSQEVLNMENLVEYTLTNIPIIKMPIGSRDITTPQYYLNTIVQDVYQPLQIDNFFQEFDDDLAIPEDPVISNLLEQRQAAINDFLALDALAAAATVGDQDAFNEELDLVEDGLASGIESTEPPASQQLTPSEFDSTEALKTVGLDEPFPVTDAAADSISPTPTVSADDVIVMDNSNSTNRVPTNIASVVDGTGIINRALEILNTGAAQIEGAASGQLDLNGNSEFISVAKGKFGRFGGGANSEKLVRREDLVNKLNRVKEAIATQENTEFPLPGYGKRKNRVGLFARSRDAIQEGRERPGVSGQLFRSSVLEPISDSPQDEFLIENSETVPMTRDDILTTLRALESKLESILAGEG